MRSEVSLLEGDELELPISFAYGEVFDLSLQSDANCVYVEQTERNTVRLIGVMPGQGKITYSDGTRQQTMAVKVYAIPSLGGDAVLAEDGIYDLYMKDTDVLSIPLVCDGELPEGFKAEVNNNTAMVEVLNGELRVMANQAGESEITLWTSVMETRPLLEARVHVAFAHQVLNAFENVALMAGTKIQIPLSFRDDVAYLPAVESTASDKVKAYVDEATHQLVIAADSTGDARISITDEIQTQSFNVHVHEMPQTEPIQADVYADHHVVSYQVLPDNLDYQVEVVHGSGDASCAEVLLDEHGMLNVKGMTPGQCEYVLRTVGLSQDVELRRIYVNASIKPALLSEFPGTYALAQGQEVGIELQFSTEPYELQYPSRPEKLVVRQEGQFLYMQATEMGEYDLSIDDGNTVKKLHVRVFPTISAISGAQITETGDYVATMDLGTAPIMEAVAAGETQSLQWEMSNQGVANVQWITATQFQLSPVSAGETDMTIYAFNGWIREDGAIAEEGRTRTILCRLHLVVEEPWALSPVSIHTKRDDTNQVIEQLVDALRVLGLTGSRDARIATARNEAGGLDSAIWDKMQEVSATYGGFSSADGWNREDYQRLLEIAEQEKQKAASVTPTPQATQMPERKEIYHIVNAAKMGDVYILLDEDGYAVATDGNGMDVDFTENDPWVLVAGNGQDGLIASYYGGVQFSSAQLGSEEHQSRLFTSFAQAAVGENCVLMLLDDQGEFALEDKDDTVIGAHHAVFWKTTGKKALIPTAVQVSKNAFAEEVSSVAAGGKVMAFVTQSGGVSKLYMKATGATALTKLLNTSVTGDDAVFKEIKFTSADQQAFDIRAVAVNDDRVALLLTDGSVMMFGSNGQGELGNGETEDSKRNTVTAVVNGQTDTPLTQVKAVVLQQACTLFLREDGTVWVCGAVAGNACTKAVPVQGMTGGAVNLIALDAHEAMAMNAQGEILVIRDGMAQSAGYLTVK